MPSTSNFSHLVNSHGTKWGDSTDRGTKRERGSGEGSDGERGKREIERSLWQEKKLNEINCNLALSRSLVLPKGVEVLILLLL